MCFEPPAQCRQRHSRRNTEFIHIKITKFLCKSKSTGATTPLVPACWRSWRQQLLEQMMDWNTVQIVNGSINIREDGYRLEFSDTSALSAHDLNMIVLYLTTDRSSWKLLSLPSPPLSERIMYCDARRPCVCVRACVCVSTKPRLHAACCISLGGEGNVLYPVLSALFFIMNFSRTISVLSKEVNIFQRWIRTWIIHRSTCCHQT